MNQQVVTWGNTLEHCSKDTREKASEVQTSMDCYRREQPDSDYVNGNKFNGQVRRVVLKEMAPIFSRMVAEAIQIINPIGAEKLRKEAIEVGKTEAGDLVMAMVEEACVLFSSAKLIDEAKIALEIKRKCFGYAIDESTKVLVQEKQVMEMSI